MALPILSALLGIVAFLPLHLYPLGFLFLIPLFIFYKKEIRLWKLIAGSVVFRLLLLLGTVYYTLEPINWSLTLLLFLGLPLSLFLIKRYIGAQYIWIAIPLLWTIFDHVEAHFSLVPTYIITAGNILGTSPFVGLARPFGIVALTVLIATINMLFAAAYDKNNPLLRRNILLATGMGIIIGTLIYSQIQLSQWHNSPTKTRHVTIASVSTDKRFDLPDAYALERDLSRTNADLVVLPESLIDESNGDDPMRWYQGIAKTLHTPVMATTRSERDGRRFISTIVMDPNGSISGAHDKTRLSFMGEYWPFGTWRPSFVDWLSQYDRGIKSYAVFNPDLPYAAGRQNVLTITTQGTTIRVASLICMEIQYPYDLIAYKRAGVQLIVTPTSNRWLGIGSSQFLYMTNNLRMIESVSTGIPIVTSGINDSAGIITPDGRMRMYSADTSGERYTIAISRLDL